MISKLERKKMKQLLFNFFMEPTIGLISWQIGQAGHKSSSGLKSA